MALQLELEGLNLALELFAPISVDLNLCECVFGPSVVLSQFVSVCQGALNDFGDLVGDSLLGLLQELPLSHGHESSPLFLFFTKFLYHFSINLEQFLPVFNLSQDQSFVFPVVGNELFPKPPLYEDDLIVVELVVGECFLLVRDAVVALDPPLHSFLDETDRLRPSGVEHSYN